MDVHDITIDTFDYPLPDERIARHPLLQRDACRLLVRRHDGTLFDARFGQLADFLPEGALIVLNNTRVINARLRFTKATGAAIEIFCLEPASPADYALNFASTASCEWMCAVGNSKRWRSGLLTMPLDVDGTAVTLTAERIAIAGDTSRVRFSWMGSASFARIIEVAGQIPIPPYLCRESEDTDRTDYQTVYSAIDGSVAAPTAGLHFTPALLSRLQTAGFGRLDVTLHVGAGTFRPVKSATIGEHPMHCEWIAVDLPTIQQLAATDRPVIAVGTTSVRTLESLYHMGCIAATGGDPHHLEQWYPYAADHPHLSRREALNALADYLQQRGEQVLTAGTSIIIVPGYRYRVVSGMVTNFHQPKSTLLLLVSAMIGDDWRAMYDHALRGEYRFLSYGDACLLLTS